MTTLYRSTLEIGEAVGRTLSGLAVPFDKIARVRDAVGPAYNEAFGPASSDVSIRQHPDGFPVFTSHRHQEDPLGMVRYRSSREGLMFEAVLSQTPAADTKLTLVNDGALRSVSVGFQPVKHVTRVMDGEHVTYRTEVRHRELSLCPSGFGAYADALVSSVRGEGDGTPALDALRRRRALMLAA